MSGGGTSLKTTNGTLGVAGGGRVGVPPQDPRSKGSKLLPDCGHPATLALGKPLTSSYTPTGGT